MFIAVDKNQCTGSHLQSNLPNHTALEAMGHTLVPTLLPYGDYALMTPAMTDVMKRRDTKLRRMDYMGLVRTVIDRKGSISEVAQNLCSTAKEHERFHNEYTLAQNTCCRFRLLIEDSTARCIDDVERWTNPRLADYQNKQMLEAQGFTLVKPLPKHPPVSGPVLAKALRTISEKYGVEVYFCTPQQAPSAIEYLLTH